MTALLAASPSDTSGSVFADPTFWAIAAVVVAIIAIAVSIVVAARARERKAIAYGVTATPLVHDLAYGQIEITHAGRSVRDVYLVEIEIGNVGNTAIRAADFEKLLMARFGKAAEVLSAEIAATQPSDLEPKISYGAKGVAILPLLLNPGDGFTIRTLVSRFDGEVDLTGRVAGVPEFQTEFVGAQERLLRSLAEATLSASAATMPFGGISSLVETWVRGILRNRGPR